VSRCVLRAHGREAREYQAGREQNLAYVRAAVSPDSIDREMVTVAEEDGEVGIYPGGTVFDVVSLPQILPRQRSSRPGGAGFSRPSAARRCYP